ncbi:Stp1/IreP family PP2C-type Ser/Thr phosphatase [Lachnoanaerobaculum gingivalis]|jgi:serine/threonine protein phosphatase|uniref:Stp1/IreP family PP2C-type Ser/Thr phosphatase n=1 Tax=Lachnoanaerobaculum gingivalis TaxID=2490855 RepID=A0A3P3QSN1_9FIRM|nr:Stp1/IreP family PP2C-type Ser/Thr phosphatase [Lachnoanaerobaculum gingivalis]RRJ24182.1 Stp1/IreP family PP2C-type Ser/Thr phosphatase [Lachnoanaerobaculum gingivalis]WHE88082.1 Stp1/IreP family PP2C-type Ser/Thr phosphatase [Lachnoanaerobaculum gingivalis]
MYSVALTDVGRKRLVNQDTVYISDTPVGVLPNLYIVADGMGGEKAGDYASKSLIGYMLTYIEHTIKMPVTAIQGAIEYANANLFAEGSKNPNLSGMGTTVVAASIIDNTLHVFNVGDSRCYVLDENSISQITKDHSLVEMLVSKGEITRESAEYKENKSKITRAVGAEERILIDSFELDLAGIEYVLLCSDGLTNMVDDRKIFNIISSSAGVKSSAKRLVEEANLSGGNDNISILLIDINEG